MSFIKDKIGLIGLMMVLIIQGGYVMVIYLREQATFLEIQKEINLAEIRREESEKHLNELSQIEEELENVLIQKQMLRNQLPSCTAVSKNTVELLRYMELNDFKEIGCRSLDVEYEIDGDVWGYTYELTFVATFEEVAGFVDNLNQSYQLIKIERLILDNAVQDLTNEENQIYLSCYQDDFSQIVRTTMEIVMYGRNDNTQRGEIYQADLQIEPRTESMFALAQSKNKPYDSDLNSKQSIEDEEELWKRKNEKTENLDGKFTLCIGDGMTSGDTYKLDGPGNEEGDYIGLMTDKDTKVIIEVYQHYYKMTIEDTEGMKEETTVNIGVESPMLEIISMMRIIEGKAPNVQVYVHNHTMQMMKIVVIGSLLEQIEVLNEQGECLGRGTTKGNLKFIE